MQQREEKGKGGKCECEVTEERRHEVGEEENKRRGKRGGKRGWGGGRQGWEFAHGFPSESLFFCPKMSE